MVSVLLVSIFACRGATSGHYGHATWQAVRLSTSSLVQVRTIFLALLIPVWCSAAACLDGRWVDGVWESTGCTLPTPAKAIMKCLAQKDILMIGDSTMRQLAYLLAETWGSQLKHLPCNLLMGHGCFDCEKGCHHKDYYNTMGRGPDWSDSTGLTPAERTLWFSWKPQMYSLDDIRLLQGFAHRGKRFDVIVVHKGVHAVADWEKYKATKMSQAAFLEENRIRANLLADLLAMYFPQAQLIWRDAYRTHQTPEKEALTDQIREMAAPIFLERGFTILPGFNVTVAVPPELQNETLHPDESVAELLLTMLASVVCPATPLNAVQPKQATLTGSLPVHSRAQE